MNQIQVIGSHNSYKQAIEPPLMKMLLARDSVRFSSLDYQHVPLAQQLDLGLRKLEIDVVFDPKGGRYANPLGLQLIKQQGGTPASFDPQGVMKEPGFKVLHVQDIDFRSQCMRLRDCLQDIKAWSDAHPRHLPIAISFNAKTDIINQPGFVHPLPFTAAAFDSLDAELLAVFPKTRVITPDQVKGNSNTASEMIDKTTPPTVPPPPVDGIPSPRQLSWLMVRPEQQLKEEERMVLSRIGQHTPVKQIYGLTQQFIEMVNKRQASKLDQWLKDCKATGIAMLESFATRIDQDYGAVRAALETEWSNGQTEGQVNRLKLLKRQMYGRANFDLLRQRVLYPT